MMHPYDSLGVMKVFSAVMGHHSKKLFAMNDERRWMVMEEIGNNSVRLKY